VHQQSLLHITPSANTQIFTHIMPREHSNMGPDNQLSLNNKPHFAVLLHIDYSKKTQQTQNTLKQIAIQTFMLKVCYQMNLQSSNNRQ